MKILLMIILVSAPQVILEETVVLKVASWLLCMHVCNLCIIDHISLIIANTYNSQCLLIASYLSAAVTVYKSFV